MPRMIWMPILAGLGFFLGVEKTFPAKPAADNVPPGASATQSIENLGNRSFRIREQAGKDLVAQGPTVLPSLRQARSNPDPEVRQRVEELIASLEKTAALTPRRVSLHLHNRPLRAAVASLADQTGYKLPLPEDGERDKQLFSFDLDDVTFWEALDKVCEAGGLSFQYNNPVVEVLEFSYQDSCVPFLLHNGPFRFVGGGFQDIRNINFSQVPRNLGDRGLRSELLAFSFALFSEPRVPLLYVGNPRLTAAYDDQKYSMLPEPPTGSEVLNHYGTGFKRYMGEISVNLVRPSEKSYTARLITGVVPVTLLAEERPEIVVDNIRGARAKKFQAGITTLTLKAVSADLNNRKAYKVALAITEDRPKDEAEDEGWINSLNQRFELRDARGHRYPVEGMDWENHTGQSAEGTLIFSADPEQGKDLGPPVKLIYNTWITVHHEVPFEFKDLPLP